jgi:hypothetical protein
MARTVIAQKIDAKNTPDGNPNRGWLVYEMEGGEIVASHFVDEGYAMTDGQLRSRGITVLPAVPTTSQFVNDARKHGRAWYR